MLQCDTIFNEILCDEVEEPIRTWVKPLIEKIGNQKRKHKPTIV